MRVNSDSCHFEFKSIQAGSVRIRLGSNHFVFRSIQDGINSDFWSVGFVSLTFVWSHVLVRFGFSIKFFRVRLAFSNFIKASIT